ncbi:MAG: hypothetical protein EOO11_01180 [Chitinophagaceae bacterium]|nr:MAG: hypothetical protein EOO11_01180 [Chitinophagaceae bacterium]
MRPAHLLLLLTLLLRLLASAQTADTLTAEQVREDIRFTARTIESIHPDPWHSISRKKFYRLRDSLLAVASHPVAAEDTWPLIARLCAAINEGHTFAWPPPALAGALRKERFGLFPVLLADLDPEGFRVRTDLSDDSTLKAGDRILAINGRSAADILRELSRYCGGLPSWRRAKMEGNALAYLHLAGIRGPFTVRYRQNGRTAEKKLPPIAYNQLIARRDAARKRNGNTAQPPPYALKRLPGNVALLEFNTMETDAQAFDRFLEDSFRTFRSAPVKGLIVDMRRNGGGNSVLGWYLLQYITGKPFRMAGGTRWKVSPEGREWYRTLDSAGRARTDSARWAAYLAKPDGFIFKSPASPPDSAQPNELRFHGPVAVLIGPNTFSSANMTANTIQDYKLATLIGEPSGEPANDYGELLFFDTPNAKVSFCSSTRHFIRANGDARDPNPVLPDILVKADPDGRTDTALEAAKKWIAAQQ